ncbi:potassium channel family protein [Maritalea mobilis]|uniref:potassium channel family protein n=1 Tax=Maritalea mobilis TaxID=483324 RepID=UPI0027E1A632|nr:potassium channel family protein [Maritalea mobilis]
MTLSGQILAGLSVFLVACLLHLLVLLRLSRVVAATPTMRLALAARLFLVIAGSHTLQVALWAFLIVAFDGLPRFGDALYFSLVTYTTLGYGDVTLPEGLRIFGAISAMAGILTFGMSTALLVSLFARARH